MNRLVASAFTSILICGNALLCAQRAVDKAETSIRPGSITGRVVADGEALPNATIQVSRLNPSSGRTRLVVTDDNGKFQVKALEPGLFRIHANAPGYVLQPADLSNEQALYRIGDSVTINMTRGGVITGKVVNTAGEPHVAIMVRATMIRDAKNKNPPYGFSVSMVRQTDDRGIYRIYGLPPGTYIVSAGGFLNFWNTSFRSNNRIYAPSSSRDTATEITVASGEEVKGVDIRYRDEAGHFVTGTVTDVRGVNSPFEVILVPMNGTLEDGRSEPQNTNTKGFEFRDVPDGEYEIWARLAPKDGELVESESKRITVRGADISGIKLVTKPFASLAGQFSLVDSTASGCKNKRRPSYEEILVSAQTINPLWRRPEQAHDSPRQVVPNNAGEFLIRNLLPGQISLNVRFFAKYWFLHSFGVPPQVPTRSTTKEVTGNSRNEIVLKSGDRITGVKIVLAEGAASVEGQVERKEGENLAEGLHFTLVPEEPDNSENVLRFFSVPVDSDGRFTLSNVPPGRYLALARVMQDDEVDAISRLRQPDQTKKRAELRRAAEAAKIQIELQPCQNLTGFHLPTAP